MDKIFSLSLAMTLSIFGLVSPLNGQEYPLVAQHWEVTGAGHVFENFKGKPSLYLFRGNAELKSGLRFFTGMIEYDVFVTERRGFPRVRFRIQDPANYEEFYIRPHQSGNPDANQYTPVFNGIAAWQLYYGSEFSAPVHYRFDQWNHIKLVIAEDRAEIYINDMETPAIHTPKLKRTPKSGTLGLGVSGPSGFYFADFKVTPQSNPALKTTAAPEAPLASGMIQSWQVSGSFPESRLEGVYMLDKKMKEGLAWQSIAAEDKGYANLARVAVRAGDDNTTFARVVIHSDTKQVKKLSYGFSDRARVYLNDQIITGGNNDYASRDYRYLGTMGYFSDVYLPLKKGRNELWIAVSENFGGWGVMARFEDTLGIKVD